MAGMKRETEAQTAKAAEIAPGRGRPFASFRPPQHPIEEKAEWEGAAPGNSTRWKRGCQGSAPREAPDVTAGRAPRPPPPAPRSRLCPPAGRLHWWNCLSLFRTHQ